MAKRFASGVAHLTMRYVTVKAMHNSWNGLRRQAFNLVPHARLLSRKMTDAITSSVNIARTSSAGFVAQLIPKITMANTILSDAKANNLSKSTEPTLVGNKPNSFYRGSFKHL